mgnify:CR=1 FL=1
MATALVALFGLSDLQVSVQCQEDQEAWAAEDFAVVDGNTAVASTARRFDSLALPLPCKEQHPIDEAFWLAFGDFVVVAAAVVVAHVFEIAAPAVAAAEASEIAAAAVASSIEDNK